MRLFRRRRLHHQCWVCGRRARIRVGWVDDAGERHLWTCNKHLKCIHAYVEARARKAQ